MTHWRKHPSPARWLWQGMIVGTLVMTGCATARKDTSRELIGPLVTHMTTLDRGLTETALDLSERLIERKGVKWTVAVLNFTGGGNRVTPFGEYLSQAMDARLGGANIQLVDRGFIARITEEMVLCAQQGDIETCASMGKVQGANAVVIGNYQVFQESVSVFLKAVETETARVILSREINVMKDARVAELLAKSGEAEPPTVKKASRWWLWAGIGTAVAGGVAAAVVLSRSGGETEPGTVSAGGGGETATIVISAPPPKARRE